MNLITVFILLDLVQLRALAVFPYLQNGSVARQVVKRLIALEQQNIFRGIVCRRPSLSLPPTKSHCISLDLPHPPFFSKTQKGGGDWQYYSRRKKRLYFSFPRVFIPSPPNKSGLFYQEKGSVGRLRYDDEKSALKAVFFARLTRKGQSFRWFNC